MKIEDELIHEKLKIKEAKNEVSRKAIDKAFEKELNELGINLDSREEAVYLDSLRKGIGMSEQQCNAIHEKLGVPTIYS